MMEQFDREIRERCAKYMETATSLLEGLEKALEDGKANKGHAERAARLGQQPERWHA